VMKNCELPVPGPALAIPKRPGRSNCSEGWNSSGITSVPPVPVPSGSPPLDHEARNHAMERQPVVQRAGYALAGL
jgi:hypothetical protein